MDKILKEQGETTRQRMYDFLVEFMTENGYSPSIREIAKGTGVKSTSNVYDHLVILEQLGMIHTENGKARTISLVGYKLIKVE